MGVKNKKNSSPLSKDKNKRDQDKLFLIPQKRLRKGALDSISHVKTKITSTKSGISLSADRPDLSHEAATDGAWCPMNVLLPLVFDRSFTYGLPPGTPVGALVYVPFGRKSLWGVVWGPAAQPEGVTVKGCHRVHSHLILEDGLRHFIQAMAGYTLAPMGMVLKLVLPDVDYNLFNWYQAVVMSEGEGCPHTRSLRDGQTAQKKIQKSLDNLQRAQPRRQLGDQKTPRMPAILRQHAGAIKTMLAWRQESSVQARTVNQWIARGWLIPAVVPFVAAKGRSAGAVQVRTDCSGKSVMNDVMINPCYSVKTVKPLALSPAQQDACDVLWTQGVALSRHHGVMVLEGVTGSGKTEVLLALCQKVWARGEQVLILLPEIALAPQWVQRLTQYFALDVQVWHSGVLATAKMGVLQAVMDGTCRVVVGARSALFLPYACLGLIVVDEEHESSYKQTEAVLYHGRDMAVLRGHGQKVPVILASATPSLESCWNVQQGRYGHVRLTHRFGEATLPEVTCVAPSLPQRGQTPQWLGTVLRQVIQDTFARGHQSLLFLNRRGYACVWMCGRCQYRAPCVQCGVWLGVHQHPPVLMCHYCGYKRPVPTACPHCHHDDALAMQGPGVERIAAEVQSLLPSARVRILSSDHVPSAKAMHATLHAITARQVDVIVGTQMVAKGHHFPYLTTIGIVDTDFALNDMDFRARERLFQTLSQVTGRAGRAHLQGQAYVQTGQPDHPLFAHVRAGDWPQFVQQELRERHRHDWPPYTRMVAVTLADRCQHKVEKMAGDLHVWALEMLRDIQDSHRTTSLPMSLELLQEMPTTAPMIHNEMTVIHGEPRASSIGHPNDESHNTGYDARILKTGQPVHIDRTSHDLSCIHGAGCGKDKDLADPLASSWLSHIFALDDSSASTDHPQQSQHRAASSVPVSVPPLHPYHDDAHLVSDKTGDPSSAMARKRDILRLLGPAPTPINPLRGYYRWRFLWVVPRGFAIEPFVRAWLGKVPLPHGMRLQIDRDPYHFL